MNSLLQHINESNIASLKNNILDIISTLSDESEDAEHIKALRKIRSVLDTTNRKSLEEFDEILKQKGLISQNKQITDIIVITGDFSSVVNAVKDENNLITFDDILSHNNFMSLFMDVFADKDIHEKTFKKLAKYCPQIKRTSCGEFEILLALLCKDAKHPAVGDLSIDDKTIELKNGSGQFVGQGIWTIDTKLPKEFNDYFKEVTGLDLDIMPITTIDMYEEFLSNTPVKLSDKIFRKLVDIYGKQYDRYDVIKDENQFINDWKEAFVGALNRNVNINEFKKFLAVYSLYIYCYSPSDFKNPTFDYLLITKVASESSSTFGDYRIFEMPKTPTFDEIYNIVDSFNWSSFPRFSKNNSHTLQLNWK